MNNFATKLYKKTLLSDKRIQVHRAEKTLSLYTYILY